MTGSSHWCPVTGPEAVSPNWGTGNAIWTLENTLCCESDWAPEQGNQGGGRVVSFEDLQSNLSVAPGKQLPCLNRVVGSDTSIFLGFWVQLIPLYCLAVKQKSLTEHTNNLRGNWKFLLSIYLFSLHWFVPFSPDWDSHIATFCLPGKKLTGSYSLPVLSIAHHDSDSCTLSFLTLDYFQKILTEVLLLQTSSSARKQVPLILPDNRRAIDFVYLDIRKAFDTVS